MSGSLSATAAALDHFLSLAKQGKHAGSSGGEKRARKLALAVINELPGLDHFAVDGLVQFIRGAQASPSICRRMIG